MTRRPILAACLLSLVMLMLSAFPAACGVWMVVGADPQGECNLPGNTSGLVTVSVVHWPDINNQATGLRYRVSTCSSSLVWISSLLHFQDVTGDQESGYVVNYGECLEGPIVVQTIYLAYDGPSPVDSAIKVMPHLLSATNQVEGIGCATETFTEVGGGICINSSGTCWCNYLGPPHHNIPCQEPVPVEATSWGKVKALYR